MAKGNKPLGFKTLKELVEKINVRSMQGNKKFGGLQEQRKKKGQVKCDKPFNLERIEEDAVYVFHSGGRKELQFNLGIDGFPERGECINTAEGTLQSGKLRYGIAFSIETGEHYFNPLETLEPYIIKYNRIIDDPRFHLSDIYLWCHKKKYVEEFITKCNYNDLYIPDEYLEEGNFIFIGKTIPTPLEKINSREVDELLSTFDRLMDVYKAVMID